MPNRWWCGRGKWWILLFTFCILLFYQFIITFIIVTRFNLFLLWLFAIFVFFFIFITPFICTSSVPCLPALAWCLLKTLFGHAIFECLWQPQRQSQKLLREWQFPLPLSKIFLSMVPLQNMPSPPAPQAVWKLFPLVFSDFQCLSSFEPENDRNPRFLSAAHSFSESLPSNPNTPSHRGFHRLSHPVFSSFYKYCILPDSQIHTRYSLLPCASDKFYLLFY